MPTLTAKEKLANLRPVIKELNANWRKANKVTDPEVPERLRFGSEIPAAELVSTGNPALDRALGGGVTRGSVIMVTGVEKVGKSTATAYFAAQIQRANLIPLWYQTEPGFPTQALRLAEVDIESMLYIDARKSGEDGFDEIRRLMMDGVVPRPEIGAIIVDSVAAMEPQAEANAVEDDGYAKSTQGRHAAMMSKLCRNIFGQGMLRCGAILWLVNQKRQQIGQGTQLPNVDTGGNAVKYGPRIIIDMRLPKDLLIKETYTKNGKKLERVIGHTVVFTITKNNDGNAMPFATGEYRVYYEKGLDVISPVIEEAVDYGIIKKGGAWYQVRVVNPDGTIGLGDKLQGEAKMLEWAETNPEKLADIQSWIDKIRTLFRTTGSRFMLVNGEYQDTHTNTVVDLLPLVATGELVETPQAAVVADDDVNLDDV